jgi:hypothetical protein
MTDHARWFRRWAALGGACLVVGWLLPVPWYLGKDPGFRWPWEELGDDALQNLVKLAPLFFGVLMLGVSWRGAPRSGGAMLVVAYAAVMLVRLSLAPVNLSEEALVLGGAGTAAGAHLCWHVPRSSLGRALAGLGGVLVGTVLAIQLAVVFEAVPGAAGALPVVFYVCVSAGLTYAALGVACGLSGARAQAKLARWAGRSGLLATPAFVLLLGEAVGSGPARGAPLVLIALKAGALVDGGMILLPLGVCGWTQTTLTERARRAELEETYR